ncbi:holotricin-3-like [Culicoides brevitarsis]|uniref:holotricin-3-like n=1 Tax=Culicoides brevitarsis TaxID=469753 RepID=UPI00307B2B53
MKFLLFLVMLIGLTLAAPQFGGGNTGGGDFHILPYPGPGSGGFQGNFPQRPGGGFGGGYTGGRPDAYSNFGGFPGYGGNFGGGFGGRPGGFNPYSDRPIPVDPGIGNG